MANGIPANKTNLIINSCINQSFSVKYAVSTRIMFKKIESPHEIPPKSLPLHPIKKEENLPESLKFFRCLI